MTPGGGAECGSGMGAGGHVRSVTVMSVCVGGGTGGECMYVTAWPCVSVRMGCVSVNAYV